jgi:hypothetical protein
MPWDIENMMDSVPWASSNGPWDGENGMDYLPWPCYIGPWVIENVMEPVHGTLEMTLIISHGPVT